MIRAKNIINLLEKYYTGVHGISSYAEVFVNPSPQDFRDTKGRIIRFMADGKTKRVYVWNGESVLHYQVFEKLKNKLSTGGIEMETGNGEIYSNLLYGTAEVERSGQNCTMISSDPLSFLHPGEYPDDKEYLQDMFSYDWSWVDRYIKVAHWLRDLKDRLEKA